MSNGGPIHAIHVRLASVLRILEPGPRTWHYCLIKPISGFLYSLTCLQSTPAHRRVPARAAFRLPGTNRKVESGRSGEREEVLDQCLYGSKCRTKFNFSGRTDTAIPVALSVRPRGHTGSAASLSGLWDAIQMNIHLLMEPHGHRQ